MQNTTEELENKTKKAKPLTPKIEELLQQSKSVILSTINEKGAPNASYAPFAQIGNKFYILVSFMAVHTKNLKEQMKASAMFIEDEKETKQIYARDRLTLDVTCNEIERDTPEWEAGISKLKETHGKILDMLSSMEDFILIELSPVKGSYVNGFGSAYTVDEQLKIVQHKNDVAHKVAKK